MDVTISTTNNEVGFGCSIRDARRQVFGTIVDTMIVILT